VQREPDTGEHHRVQREDRQLLTHGLNVSAPAGPVADTPGSAIGPVLTLEP
jgi:hypothetical protein